MGMPLKCLDPVSRKRVSLKPGGTGTYHVNWRVLSVDTHTTNGNFTFEVGK